ncbi:MAG TPA: hypothetical protein VFQ11_12950 [Nocardioidaceae bacterium]|nr:hypothetical protein [Nocardioidaceae bacterium]
MLHLKLRVPATLIAGAGLVLAGTLSLLVQRPVWAGVGRAPALGRFRS